MLTSQPAADEALLKSGTTLLKVPKNRPKDDRLFGYGRQTDALAVRARW